MDVYVQVCSSADRSAGREAGCLWADGGHPLIRLLKRFTYPFQ